MNDIRKWLLNQSNFTKTYYNIRTITRFIVVLSVFNVYILFEC